MTNLHIKSEDWRGGKLYYVYQNSVSLTRASLKKEEAERWMQNIQNGKSPYARKPKVQK